MKTADKLALIARYESAGEVVKEWATLPSAVLDRRPSEDRWTIREHLVHLLDADINGISRARKAIAEPGSPIYPYEEELWTASLAYRQADLKLIVELFSGLRRFMGDTLRNLVEKDWTALFYLHPKNGKVDLENYLHHYIDHVEFHREYVERLQAAD